MEKRLTKTRKAFKQDATEMAVAQNLGELREMLIKMGLVTALPFYVEGSKIVCSEQYLIKDKGVLEIIKNLYNNLYNDRFNGEFATDADRHGLSFKVIMNEVQNELFVEYYVYAEPKNASSAVQYMAFKVNDKKDVTLERCFISLSTQYEYFLYY